MMMEWKKLLSPHRLGSSAPGAITPDRSPFQRDFDRIVFSGSFRRLQDKTQVFPLARNDYVHTRLTHSIEASSIARSLGTAAGVEICRNFDTGNAHPSDVGAAVAAAALAHDIGNPPLGHAGEEAIRYWFAHSGTGRRMREYMSDVEARDIEHYDGNAQGFRILTRLEMPDRTGGMQLTCATLGTFAKYPGTAGEGWKKGGVFRSELPLFREVAEHCGLIPLYEASWKRHPLSYLLEAADDIAYLSVDFEDGMRQGLIEYGELERDFLAIIDSDSARDYVRTLGSCCRKAEYLRAQVVGVLVRASVKFFLEHIEEIMRGEDPGPLTEGIECREVLERIRSLSVQLIYNSRDVAEIVGAGFEMVQGMLDIFVPCVNELAEEAAGGPAASSRSRRISAMLPMIAAGDAQWKQSGYIRLLRLLDYISGMTDRYAVTLYQKLKGISL